MPEEGIKPARSWREVAQEASRQTDPKKLLELTAELESALEEREKQKHTKREHGSLPHTSA